MLRDSTSIVSFISSYRYRFIGIILLWYLLEIAFNCFIGVLNVYIIHQDDDVCFTIVYWINHPKALHAWNIPNLDRYIDYLNESILFFEGW